MKISAIREYMNTNATELDMTLNKLDEVKNTAVTYSKASKAAAIKVEGLKTKKTSTAYKSAMGEKAVSDEGKKNAMADYQSMVDSAYLHSLCKGASCLTDIMNAWMVDFERPVLTIKVSKDMQVSISHEQYPVTLSTILAYAKDVVEVPEDIMNKFHDAMISMYAWQVRGWYDESTLPTKQQELADLFAEDTIVFGKHDTTAWMTRSMQDIIDELFGLDEDEKKVIKFVKPMIRRYTEIDSKLSRTKSGEIKFANESDFVGAWTYVFHEIISGNLYTFTK